MHGRLGSDSKAVGSSTRCCTPYVTVIIPYQLLVLMLFVCDNGSGRRTGTTPQARSEKTEEKTAGDSDVLYDLLSILAWPRPPELDWISHFKFLPASYRLQSLTEADCRCAARGSFLAMNAHFELFNCHGRACVHWQVPVVCILGNHWRYY